MQPAASSSPRRITVTFGKSREDRRTLTFDREFVIGRTDNCDVCLKDDYVSRNHARVSFEDGHWCVSDLQSANGLFVNGERVPVIPVGEGVTFRLGIGGPFVSLEPERLPPPPAPVTGGQTVMVARYMEHYFGKGESGQPVGEHTMIVRRAFQTVQKKQRWRYAWALTALGALFLAAGAYAFYVQRQLRRQQALAENIFYTMKSLDVDIANVENLVRDSNNKQGVAQVRRYQSRRKEMEKNYDQFLASLRVYNPKMTPQERLILRVARIFGECEIDMPPDFTKEVESYIGKWKSSGRFARDVRTANEKGYTPVIYRELLAQDLPPQFFYLALQESDFDQYISGPMTYKGIAKGMWQFIPETAVKYGLKIGPLADLRRPDPGDDRDHFEKATHAAASYLKDLYSTEAQASGMLVMASYNWGEVKVIPLIESMPANPRERNFWKLLSSYREKIPQETYDYVFYIFSAAVIGENPRLFGFDFDNPLEKMDAGAS